MSGNSNKPAIIAASAAVFMLLASIILRVCILASDGNADAYIDPVLSVSSVRGTIYDRNGEILAIQAPEYGFLSASGSDAPRKAAFISAFTDESAVSLEHRIRSGESFIAISVIPDHQAEEEIARLLRQSGLEDELALTRIEKRIAVAGSDVLGSTDAELNGASGLERLMQKELDAVPSLYSEVAYGHDVFLTIDKETQQKLESLAIPSPAAVIDGEGIAAWTGKASRSVLGSLVMAVRTHSGQIIYEGAQGIPELKTSGEGSVLRFYSEDAEYLPLLEETFRDGIIS